MFKFVSRLAISAVLFSSAVFGQCRIETYQCTPSNGMTAEISGCNLPPGHALIFFEPKIGGYSFGLSGTFQEAFTSTNTLSYKGPDNQIKHHVRPLQFPWGPWAAGLGDAEYTITF